MIGLGIASSQDIVHSDPPTGWDWNESSRSLIKKAALAAASKGWRVFPCQQNKMPYIKGWPEKATTDPTQIRSWWKKWPDASIGVITGSESGILVLDVDLPAGPESLARLEAEYGALPVTLEQTTGSGGRHLIFVLPEGIEVRNSAGKLGPGLDVRGSGGFVILAPSQHLSGNCYKWVDENVPPAIAPKWLVELISNKPSAISCSGPEKYSTTTYGRRALESECYRLTTATERSRNDTLNKAAFSIGQLVNIGQIDEAEAREGLYRSAHACGMDDQKDGVLATINSGLTASINKPRKTLGSEPQMIVEAKLPQPVPFDSFEAPEIRPNMLPGMVGDFVAEVAEILQVPPELVMVNALGAIAVAGQRKFRILVKPGYSEPLSLYALCPLPPGERKSATVEICKAPLVEWEKAKADILGEEIKKLASERKTLEKCIEAKRTEAGKAKSTQQRNELIGEIVDLERNLPEVPSSPCLLAYDITPERLAHVLFVNDQRIGFLDSEGGLFDTIAGRYQNNVPNLDLFLKGWSGESTAIDRVSRSQIILDNPHITLVVSPQPEVIRSLAGKPGFRGRGLLGRFLYVMPKSRLGYREDKDTCISEALRREYSRKIKNTLDYPWASDACGEKTSYIISLSDEAAKLRRDFWYQVEAEQRPEGEFDGMTDWSGKFPGLGVRIAGLLHLATSDNPLENISGQTMKSALDLAALLADHAKVAFSLMGSDPAMDCAQAVLKWITYSRLTSFTERDAFQKVKGRFPTMAEVRPGLNLLEERAYIFSIPQVERQGPGRKPATGYTVNPLTLGD